MVVEKNTFASKKFSSSFTHFYPSLFFRFILYGIFRAIIVGFVQMTSDYFVKPILTALFNGAIQPVMLLLQNIFQSLWNTLEPLAQMLFGFLKPFIECLKAIRIVDIHINSERENSKPVTGENIV